MYHALLHALCVVRIMIFLQINSEVDTSILFILETGKLRHRAAKKHAKLDR